MIPLILARVAPYAAVVGLSFSAAWYIQGKRIGALHAECAATIEAIKRQEAEEAARAADEMARKLWKAEAAGREAERQLAEVQRKLKEANTNAQLKLYSLGNDPALRGPALRVLNDFPSLSFSTVPEAAGGAPSADAPAPTDTDYAGERDIAAWIAEVGGLYEECRAKIAGIAAWYAAQE